MTGDGVRANSPKTMPTHFHGRPEEERALDAFIKLARCVASLGAHLGGPRSHLGTAGLTESQFGVLETLLHLGPLHQCRLAQKHLLSPGNLTLVINNLQRDGLVRRQRSTEDRRYVEVQLTDAGRALITDLFPPARPGGVRGVRHAHPGRAGGVGSAVPQVGAPRRGGGKQTV